MRFFTAIKETFSHAVPVIALAGTNVVAFSLVAYVTQTEPDCCHDDRNKEIEHAFSQILTESMLLALAFIALVKIDKDNPLLPFYSLALNVICLRAFQATPHIHCAHQYQDSNEQGMCAYNPSFKT